MHIVYKTTNQINGKIYVGVHSADNDGYLGSGKKILLAINKYGKENFIRETLFEFPNAEQAYEKEAEIVDQDFLARSDVYNIALGGMGGILKMNKGRILTDEEKFKISKGVKNKFERDGFNRVYKPASQGSKDALRRNNKARTERLMTTKIQIGEEVYSNKFDAAEKCGVNPKTIANWIKSGKARTL